jgi:two-component system, response regulator PdtaR
MGGSVLVVEDEFLIRAAVVDCLTDAGHAVVEAANASSALDALKSTDVDVAVLDIRLPGQMDGLALAEWIGANRPHVQIILVSGDLSAVVRRAGAKAALWFLEKPFAGAALQRMVEVALTGRSALASSQQRIPRRADPRRGCSP